MRSHFSADWAFGIAGAIKNIVKAKHPGRLRQWPLVQTFNFEAYHVGDTHCVMVLRDKLSGVPAGPGDLKPFPYHDHPPLPVTIQNVSAWIAYLPSKFSLQPEDAAIVLPIHDCGKNSALDDYELFSEEERLVWEVQIQTAVARQDRSVQLPTINPPAAPSIINNFYGANSRLNVATTDNSTNVVEHVPDRLFDGLLTAIRDASARHDQIQQLSAAVGELKAARGTRTFAARYQHFMSVLADHIQVFGPVVAPYLGPLAKLLQE